jgi:hypothetical protein
MLKPARKRLLPRNESVPDCEILRPELATKELSRVSPFERRIALRLVASSYPDEDSALVRQWLLDGIPVPDVMTMLEVRYRFRLSPNAARSYAAEIIFAVWREIPATKQPTVAHRKEIRNAVA